MRTCRLSEVNKTHDKVQRSPKYTYLVVSPHALTGEVFESACPY